jgi:hypothetical protein
MVLECLIALRVVISLSKGGPNPGPRHYQTPLFARACHGVQDFADLPFSFYAQHWPIGLLVHVAEELRGQSHYMHLLKSDWPIYWEFFYIF